ncbi:hypothetical protein B0H14DRAFT_2584870 [Mycena olivaceomarginata]|nr:hypothetical protein B0H14DRAFT_2584870 [Mycena olivaceomarginata]
MPIFPNITAHTEGILMQGKQACLSASSPEHWCINVKLLLIPRVVVPIQLNAFPQNMTRFQPQGVTNSHTLTREAATRSLRLGVIDTIYTEIGGRLAARGSAVTGDWESGCGFQRVQEQYDVFAVLIRHEPLIDKIQVIEDFDTALPVLEYYTDNFGNTTCPHSFKLFISGINKILLFLDNVPGVWANYFVKEEARGVQLEGFQIPFVEPPLLLPLELEFSFTGSPIYLMTESCPAGFYPRDCDDAKAAFIYKPQRKFGGDKSSSTTAPVPSTSTAKSSTRAPAASSSSLARASLSGHIHNSTAHRIQYILVLDRKTIYTEDKNSTAQKCKKKDTSPCEDSDTPVIVDEPINVNDTQSINARVLKKAKLEAKEPSLKTPVAKPQGSSNAISAAPHRKPVTGAKLTVARELSAAELNAVTGNFKSIFTHMVTNKEFGTNPTDKNPAPEDFPIVLPTIGCQKCKLEHKHCIPSGLGSSYFNCVQAGFCFCDHHQTLNQLMQTQLELAETYAMASDGV